MLKEETNPDKGKCERSQLTGELVITVPKVQQRVHLEVKKEIEKITINEHAKKNTPGLDYKAPVDYRSIVADNEAKIAHLKQSK